MKLTDQQKYVLNSGKRFACVVAGRRGGKSYMSIASLAKAARFPNKTCVYIAPTHGMCRQVLWKPLKAMLREKGWVKKVNESNLEITLVNGSIIMLRSGDNPDRLRGLSISHCVIDEAADIQEELFFEVVRPALADQQGTALIISTPKGKGWLFDLFHNYANHPDWLCHSYTTAAGGIVDQSEIDSARETMGEREFKQEFLADWVSMENQIYYAFGDHNIQSMPVPLDQRVPVHIGLDFNYTPFCATVGYQHQNGIHIFDEIELYGTDTQEMAREIRNRFPTQKIIVYPDASGAQHRTSAIGGVTDHIILKNAGFDLRVGSINPAVKDRIAAVNAALKSADGIIKLTIDPKCKSVIEGLRKHSYKQGTRQPEKDGAEDFSHFMDALGYCVNSLYPLKQDIRVMNQPIRRSTGGYR
jgi:hypothetical protein